MKHTIFRTMTVVALVILAIVMYWVYTRHVMVAATSLPRVTLYVGEQPFYVEVASTPSARKQGLSDRQSLAPRHGMYFTFPDTQVRQFWMIHMYFALDMLWIRDHRVVGITPNVPFPQNAELPSALPRYSSQEAVNAVLELPAGSSDRYGLQVGDGVRLEH